MCDFKVGDKVRCIGESSGPSSAGNIHYGGAGWRKDRVFTIKSIVGNVCWGAKEIPGVFTHHLELESDDWDE